MLIALTFFVLRLFKKLVTAYIATRAQRTIQGSSVAKRVSEPVIADSTQQALAEYRAQFNCVKNRISSGEITNISQVNAQLEIHQTFGKNSIDEHTVELILKIMLTDLTTCNIEKIITLEFLAKYFKQSHLGLLKELFVVYGKKNYLFDIELYKAVMECEGESEEKLALLNYMSTRMSLTPELAINKAS